MVATPSALRPSLAYAIVAALAIAVFGVARAQSGGYSILADRPAYAIGDTATIRVAGLTECASQRVRLGLRDVTRGAQVAAAETQLDASGNGAASMPVADTNGGNPVQAAAWAPCLNRGFEPGLALDPHPLLISISPGPAPTSSATPAASPTPAPPRTGAIRPDRGASDAALLVTGLGLLFATSGGALALHQKRAAR